MADPRSLLPPGFQIVEDAPDPMASLPAGFQVIEEGAKPTQTSQALGFYQGFMKPLDNAAQALEAGAGALGLNTGAINRTLGLPSASEAAKGHADYIAEQEAQGVAPGGIGRFVGEVAGTLPVAAVSTNPFAAGAMSGALLTDAKDVGGVLLDAGIGALAGKAGDMAVKGISRAIAPKVAPSARNLLNEGVELTPGQIIGGTAKRIEDAATSVPIVGDTIKSAQRRSLESFNKAAINRTIAPIGDKLPKDMKPGYDAITYAGEALSKAYDTVLPKLTVSADVKFDNAVNNLKSLVTNLPADRATQVTNIIDSAITKFSPAGKMSGETMKAIDSELGRLVRSYGGSQIGDERLVGNAIKQFQQELRDVVMRSNPGKASVLKAIDRGYANLLRVENAAKAAKDGVFTPGQLQTATRVMDKTLGKRASARGSALMQDLATAARDRLPSSVPDSGTPTRMLTNVLAGGGLGYVEPNALMGGLAASAAYTRPGQNALRFLLARNPSASAQQVANYFAQLKGPAAIAGAALPAWSGE